MNNYIYGNNYLVHGFKWKKGAERYRALSKSMKKSLKNGDVHPTIRNRTTAMSNRLAVESRRVTTTNKRLSAARKNAENARDAYKEKATYHLGKADKAMRKYNHSPLKVARTAKRTVLKGKMTVTGFVNSFGRKKKNKQG